MNLGRTEFSQYNKKKGSEETRGLDLCGKKNPFVQTQFY